MPAVASLSDSAQSIFVTICRSACWTFGVVCAVVVCTWSWYSTWRRHLSSVEMQLALRVTLRGLLPISLFATISAVLCRSCVVGFSVPLPRFDAVVIVGRVVWERSVCSDSATLSAFPARLPRPGCMHWSVSWCHIICIGLATADTWPWLDIYPPPPGAPPPL